MRTTPLPSSVSQFPVMFGAAMAGAAASRRIGKIIERIRGPLLGVGGF
jgi:hypothetical protein